MKRTIWLLLAATTLLGANDALAQRGRREVREGNRLYAEGRYDEAYEKYLEALRANPESPVIRFNEANALYRSEEFQRALEAYRQAAETDDPALKAQALYNLGNALYRGQQLEESLEAYKEALRLGPTDENAKHNFERVLQQMQQQQQQQQPDPQSSPQDQAGEPGQPPPQPQDQPQEQPQGDQQQEPSGQPPPQPEDDPSSAEQPPREGRMSREEAERLLQAIDEDPNEVDRRRARGSVRRRPRKDW